MSKVVEAGDRDRKDVAPADNSSSSPDPPPPPKYSCSPGLASRLRALDISLVFTSYQSGLLYLLGVGAQGQINVHQTALPKPMGLRSDGSGGFLLATGFQLIRYRNTLNAGEIANGQFDACFLPRQIHVTGGLDAHDVGMDGEDRPVFVNTRFNGLARPGITHSFEEIWRPSFVTDLVDEDRCHLNGLAMRDGRAAYVTAVSRSNTIDGWRDRRADGGVVIHVSTGEVVCDGLSMPHSPRWHDGRLWVLNSGTGELGTVDPTGKAGFKPLCFCPGFVRGLAFAGRFALVGLSKPRYERFTGLDLDRRLTEADSEPWCGVQIIDTATGACVDWFRIDGQVGEIYDVEALPGLRCPMAVAPGTRQAATTVTWARAVSSGMERAAGQGAEEGLHVTAFAADTPAVAQTGEGQGPTVPANGVASSSSDETDQGAVFPTSRPSPTEQPVLAYGVETLPAEATPAARYRTETEA